VTLSSLVSAASAAASRVLRCVCARAEQGTGSDRTTEDEWRRRARGCGGEVGEEEQQSPSVTGCVWVC
jgi:hypothetical protein